MSGVPEIYVIRHGETEWNRQGRWQGRLDSELTEQGERQARAVGTFLREIGVTPTSHAFYSSPLGRARRSAALILGDAADAHLDPRLAEIDVGDWTGWQRTDVLRAAGLPPDTDMLEAYRRVPGGERFEAVMERARSFLSDLQRPAVLVTHGITSRFLRAAAMGWPVERIGEFPGGQGVVHHVAQGAHRSLDAMPPEAEARGMT